MFNKNLLLYLVLGIILLSFSGCPGEKTVETPAFIVIDSIPERVKKEVFESLIQNIKKEERDNINKAYTLDEDNDYVLVLEEEKTSHLLEIFRKNNYAPLFKDPKAEKLIEMIPEWQEITCLTPRNTPKEVKGKDGSGQEKIYSWYKIKIGAKEGWILSDYLLFKSFNEKNAVVIKNFKFLSIPVYSRSNIIRELEEGLTVTFTGYEYSERNYDTELTHIKVYDSYGWGVKDNMLVDAHIGVVLADEITLYNAPEDIKANAEDDVMYTKMEIVPILDLLENDWYKVVKYKDAKDKKASTFYIKEGNDKISSKKDDITFASWVRDDYYEGMKIINEIFDAKAKDPVQGVALLPDKFETTKRLGEIFDYIEEKKNAYPNSVFAGIGPFSLREFQQNLTLAKADLERTMPAIKEEPVEDEEPELDMNMVNEYEDDSGGM